MDRRPEDAKDRSMKITFFKSKPTLAKPYWLAILCDKKSYELQAWSKPRTDPDLVVLMGPISADDIEQQAEAA